MAECELLPQICSSFHSMWTPVAGKQLPSQGLYSYTPLPRSVVKWLISSCRKVSKRLHPTSGPQCLEKVALSPVLSSSCLQQEADDGENPTDDRHSWKSAALNHHHGGRGHTSVTVVMCKGTFTLCALAIIHFAYIHPYTAAYLP